MTKEEILNGMSEKEFYSLYPTKQAWEAAQQKMNYGGSPFIQGFPFGAGITLEEGGTPYYGGPIYPAKFGGDKPCYNCGGSNMKHGGDTTEQGANEDFLTQRSNSYKSFIKNNVMKNLQEEEFNKVHNAYMQMEHEYQVGGFISAQANMQDYRTNPFQNKFNPATINQSNRALQNMYAQNINQYKNQSRQDFQNFGAMATDFVGQMTAQDGRIVMPNWEYSNYVPQNDIRTGYALGKSDYAKLAKLQGQGKVTGAKFNYGALGRVAPRMFGPKSIEVGYMNPNKGAYEDLKAPLNFNSETQEGPKERKNWFKKKAVATPAQTNPNPYAGVNDDVQHGELFPQGVYAPGKSPQDFMSSNLYRQPKPSVTGPVDRTDNSWEEFMSKKNMSMAPYSEQLKAFGGLVKAQSGYQNPIAFQPRIEEDDQDIQVPVNTPVVKEDPNYNPFTDQAAIQKRRQEQRDMFGPPMGDKPDIMATDTVKFKKKTTGVGKFFGKNAPLIADTFSSILEGKENRKNEQKMKDLMLADNSFLTTPMNAKNRGDYDPNSGMFRPDQKVPVRFPGYAMWGGFNTMQKGGQFDEGEELDLSPEEIADLKAQGYELEELD